MLYREFGCANRKNTHYMDRYCKRFSILTVVFLHTHNGYDTSGKAVFYINKWITSFHMALFFVFAGYFFKIPNTLANIKKEIKKKARSLLIPYIIWGCVIGFFVENIRLLLRTGTVGEIIVTLSRFITGRKFFMVVPWFLFVLMGVYFVEYLLSLIIKDYSKKTIVWVVFSCLCLPLGYFIGRYPFSEYFRISLILISCFFFAFGMVLKQIMDRITSIKQIYQLLLGISVVLLGGIICVVNGKVSYFIGQFGNEVLHTISALSTTTGLSILIYYLHQNKWFDLPGRFLEFFGSHSVIVFLTHPILLYGIRIVEKIFHMEIHTFPAIPAFIIVVALQYALIRFMPKNLLWTFGK